MGYDWEPADLECIDELKLNKAEIETLDDPWDKPTAEDNKDLNDFLECSWKKEGTLKDNGEIDWDKVDDYITQELKKEIEENKSNSEEILANIIAGGIIQNAVDKCREEKIHGSSPGQTVAKSQNCIAAKLRETMTTLGD